MKNVAVSYAGSNKITCFNTGGMNAEGKPFSKPLHISKGKVQALWFGVGIPQNQKPGLYKFDVIITPENAQAQNITLQLNISKNSLKDRGDAELWRLSRLRWLNSTLGIDDKVVAPYPPIKEHFKTLVSGKPLNLKPIANNYKVLIVLNRGFPVINPGQVCPPAGGFNVTGSEPGDWLRCFLCIF